MKVDAHLLLVIQRIEKKIHQECLAATDTAPKVHAPGGRLTSASRQVPPQSIYKRTAPDDGVLQLIETVNHALLCGVDGQALFPKRGRVCRSDCHQILFISGAA